MTAVHPLAGLRRSPTAWLFEGHCDGVELSFFVTAYEHGEGPRLHRHPYPEVFLVQEGVAAFTAGEERLQVIEGHVVVIDAETPHAFANAGTATLRVVSIHPSARVVQTDL